MIRKLADQKVSVNAIAELYAMSPRRIREILQNPVSDDDLEDAASLRLALEADRPPTALDKAAKTERDKLFPMGADDLRGRIDSAEYWAGRSSDPQIRAEYAAQAVALEQELATLLSGDDGTDDDISDTLAWVTEAMT